VSPRYAAGSSHAKVRVLVLEGARDPRRTAWVARFPERGSHMVVRQDNEELLVSSIRPGKGTWDKITLDVPLTKVCKTIESGSLPPDLPSP